MSWNYRIVRYRNNEGFGLHEVYYDADGMPWGMTEDAVRFVCDAEEGPSGVKGSLLMAQSDSIKRPILDLPEDGKWPGKAP